ncbi:MAG TPA: hypothetical protein VFQ85_08170 [Mycobacteriales bacterium]|jgi:hypothetical protein|nr:hypothetical protein [Mycobacteriales bacterium]
MVGVPAAARIAAQVHTTVDPNGLPGHVVLQQMLNGLMFVGLLGCAAAVVLGGATWWLASHGGNYGAALGGRKAVLAGLAGALVIGGAAQLVNAFYHLGRAVR